MKPAFFMPGTTMTHRALSSRSWGTPLSSALIMSVSVSAEASSLSSTLISRSAAKAVEPMEPAIARIHIQRFEFVFIRVNFLFSFCRLVAQAPPPRRAWAKTRDLSGCDRHADLLADDFAGDHEFHA